MPKELLFSIYFYYPYSEEASYYGIFIIPRETLDNIELIALDYKTGLIV